MSFKRFYLDEAKKEDDGSKTAELFIKIWNTYLNLKYDIKLSEDFGENNETTQPSIEPTEEQPKNNADVNVDLIIQKLTDSNTEIPPNIPPLKDMIPVVINYMSSKFNRMPFYFTGEGKFQSVSHGVDFSSFWRKIRTSSSGSIKPRQDFLSKDNNSRIAFSKSSTRYFKGESDETLANFEAAVREFDKIKGTSEEAEQLFDELRNIIFDSFSTISLRQTPKGGEKGKIKGIEVNKNNLTLKQGEIKTVDEEGAKPTKYNPDKDILTIVNNDIQELKSLISDHSMGDDEMVEKVTQILSHYETDIFDENDKLINDFISTFTAENAKSLKNNIVKKIKGETYKMPTQTDPALEKFKFINKFYFSNDEQIKTLSNKDIKDFNEKIDLMVDKLKNINSLTKIKLSINYLETEYDSLLKGVEKLTDAEPNHDKLLEGIASVIVGNNFFKSLMLRESLTNRYKFGAKDEDGNEIDENHPATSNILMVYSEKDNFVKATNITQEFCEKLVDKVKYSVTVSSAKGKISDILKAQSPTSKYDYETIFGESYENYNEVTELQECISVFLSENKLKDFINNTKEYFVMFARWIVNFLKMKLSQGINPFLNAIGFNQVKITSSGEITGNDLLSAMN